MRKDKGLDGSKFIACMVMIIFSMAGFSASKKESHTLEELIVTAQKREQLLQTIPVALSVMNASQLKSHGISSIGDLVDSSIPSLRIQPTGNTPSNIIVAIRGNGPGDPSEVTREGSVAIYLDGVYLARSQGLGMELADLEQVEVLRGPQGTLFGRNAIAGAVNLVSKKPTGQFGIKQTLSKARYDEFRSVTHINFPEVGQVRAKLDYLHSERDGWVDNTAPGQADYTEYEKDGGRLNLRWQLAEDVAVDYSYDQSRIETAQNYVQFYKDNIGVFGEERRRLTKTRLPVTPLKATISDTKGHGLIATWVQSENLTIKSITAYRDLDIDANNNYGGVLYFNGLNDASIIEQDQYSQELQLIGSHERLEWVAGLYYFEEDVDKTLNDSFTLDIFGNFGDALTPISPPIALPPRIVKAEARSQAIYGQLTWNPEILDDRLYLTLGGRYTEDKRSVSRFELGFSESDQESDNFDTTGVISYQWRDSLSVYFKRSTAYKAGGVNTRSASFEPFNEEVSEAYELGLKAEFWDQKARLNVAVFQTDYNDLQLTFTDPVVVTVVETINAQKTAEVDGIEVELSLSPVAGLVFGLSYSYLDNDMPLQQNPLDNDALREFFVPLAPQHAGALTLDYEFRPSRYGTVRAHLDVNSTDHYSYLPYGEQRTDAYTLVNARLTLADIDIGEKAGSLQISAWGKNLMDEKYIAFAFAVGDPAVSIGQVFGDPRTMGIDITYEF